MYAQSRVFKNLVDALAESVGSKQNARLLLYIELTLFLAVQLGLEAEPLTVGWVLLSRMPLQHRQLDKLSSRQRRMCANAAIIVPLSSRSAWESALVEYVKIPQYERLYRIQPNNRFDDQMIAVCRQESTSTLLREEQYEILLTEQLPYDERAQRQTVLGETYKVTIKNQDGVIKTGRVTITEAMQTEHAETQAWFDTPRPRTSISVRLQDLHPTAIFLDKFEEQSNGRVHWVRDLEKIRFCKANTSEDHLSLEPENIYPLDLKGAVHLPGMVSSGKTTLAKLIIAHCIRLNLDMRITLVVGDSHTAIETAHQVNSWFCPDPAGEDVVAVPLFGASQRETHLRRLLVSREYHQSQKAGRPHWGERWLMPVCPLASQIKWEGEENVMIPAGNEPCAGLIDEPVNSRRSGKRHLCPLSPGCPTKQIYRDMPRTQLWVTTAGAFSQAALPLYLDPRIAKLGDLVYEQSDLVILDEVETIVEWFDRTFAQKVELTNGKNGLLDRLDPQIALYWSANRVLPSDQRRWVMAARDSLKALSGILTAIIDPKQERTVKKWVQGHHFNPNQLAYRMARRLAGLKEWDDTTTSLNERRENERLTQEAFAAFDELLNRTPDPLRLQIPPAPVNVDQVGELSRLMQSINTPGDDGADADIFRQCNAWILRWHPAIEVRLEALKRRLEHSGNSYDEKYLKNQFDRSVSELAQRLQFLLTVALLDRHMHIVLQEWHNKPEELDAAQPFGRIPRGMRNILPLPLMGQQFGFRSAASHTTPDREASNQLSLFMHTNIGRSYILNFHHLREDLEELSGPHVLALSGTSYLPDSTAFHVTLPPAGILLASEQTHKALGDSRFVWQHFVDERGRPIRVSGMPDKSHQLRLLVRTMLAAGGMTGGFIGKVLRELAVLGQKNRAQWEDRERVLLLTNSYPQAKAVAQALRSAWPEAAESIFNLKQGRWNEDSEAEFEQQGELQRIDIEQFASVNGRVLVAPLQSIGRGFNILNNAAEPKAAFGAVFFLTRPMNPPHDMEASAQELNRYALEWADNRAFQAWAEDTLYQRAIHARECAMELRRHIEHRRAYQYLRDDSELQVFPRRDLAATTAGRIIQAVGRLMRGEVPFRAYFVDAAWSPKLAGNDDVHVKEPEETSLLTAVSNILEEYAQGDAIGQQLYGGLSEALITTENRDSN